MKLELLCRAAGLACPEAYLNTEIEKIVTDSRESEKGSMYLCIPGLHTDGHRYAKEAVEKGAVCVVAQEGYNVPNVNVCVLIGQDVRECAARLYHAFYGFPGKKLKLVGVTGTNGKTTVSRLLCKILEDGGHKCGIIGTLGVESLGKPVRYEKKETLANMTTPDPWDLYPILSEMAEDGVEYVIMEVSSHALSLGKVAPLQFCMGIFTNLTPEHLDFHLTMENYAEAKSRLFRRCDMSILNADSPAWERMKKASAGRVVTCSAKKEADYRADSEIIGEDGVRYRLYGKETSVEIACPIPGIFTLMNSMQAAVAAMELGIDPEIVRLSLSHQVGVKGRMERVDLGKDAEFSVYIDYAHTPDAMENLLRSATLVPHEGQIVLLFGCGGDRDRAKRPAMGEVASHYADRVFLTSDNARSEDPMEIIREILPGIHGVDCRIIPNREIAIREAVYSMEKGDLLLLAGKGHEEYEIIGERRRPFSEREIVRSAYRERRGKER